MRLAIDEAVKAEEAGEVPVGAVVIGPAGEILASRGNRRERDHDPTAHAELLALREAGARLGTWRLEGCTLVSTMEPCPMCAGAAVLARVERVVYGCPDPKAGSVDTMFRITSDPRLNHRAEVKGGVLERETASLLEKFFRSRR
ncbi:MAG: nucleoside deaminase [Deltaproteobacteria bacterium]|nr:nucleoside deaminase [Deltaproteobacteria bacterium]